MKDLRLASNIIYGVSCLLFLFCVFASHFEGSTNAFTRVELRETRVFASILYLALIGYATWARAHVSIDRHDERVTPANGIALVIVGIVVAGLGLPTPSVTAAVIFLVGLNLVIVYGRIPSGIFVTLLSVPAALMNGLYHSAYPAAAATAVGYATTMVGIWIGGSLVSELKDKSALFEQARWAASEFANANMKLQDSVDKTEETTRNQERIRLARQIHDTIGYTLTAVLVQINTVQELIRVDLTQAQTRLSRLEPLIRLAIQDVRVEIGTMREESVEQRPWPIRWKNLCTVFSDCTGVMITTAFHEVPESISPQIGETVYRVVQETMTNAYRHGSASHINVAAGVNGSRSALLLRVSDNGIGSHFFAPGNGLTGIRERVGALNGTVVWQTIPYSGFDIGVEIPLVRRGTYRE